MKNRHNIIDEGKKRLRLYFNEINYIGSQIKSSAELQSSHVSYATSVNPFLFLNRIVDRNNNTVVKEFIPDVIIKQLNLYVRGKAKESAIKMKLKNNLVQIQKVIVPEIKTPSLDRLYFENDEQIYIYLKAKGIKVLKPVTTFEEL